MVQELKENEIVQSYLSAVESQEAILKEIKPIIKNAKQGYEAEHIILQYQPRFKKQREFDIPLVKEQSWAKYVLEERVKEDIFDSLVEASVVMNGNLQLETTIENPERFYSVKEVDVSAVLVKDK